MTDYTTKQDLPPNPLMPEVQLEAPASAQPEVENTNPQKHPHELDSACTRAEKIERHGLADDINQSPSKRFKLSHVDAAEENSNGLSKSERQKGVAPIKAEFLVYPRGSKQDRGATVADDDTAEAASHGVQSFTRNDNKRDKKRGQNTARSFGSSREEVTLCQSRAHSSEFSPEECRFGEKCKYEHDLRKYLNERKRGDLVTFGGVCPVWKANGKCGAGWKCRFVGSHMQEREVEAGRREFILTEDASFGASTQDENNQGTATVNNVPTQAKIDLLKRRIKTPKADAYNQWLDINSKEVSDKSRSKGEYTRTHEGSVDNNMESDGAIHDNRALYTEPPFMPSEKRRIYFGPETPVLAPLTTQGNLPFRRLCISLGAQVTYSEMAMSLPLIQGTKAEWALMRAHQSETFPPRFDAHNSVVEGYDKKRDSKFGAQISANKPWQAFKATEILTSLCPQLRVIDLNCGCPIDLVYRAGAGSALLDSHAKLEKMLRGMNAVSGDIPITVKIRMGTKDNKPSAEKLVDRLVNRGNEALDGGQGPAGIAAITLHGRSRQQRYTKNADWSYISECAALIKRYDEKKDDLSDTIREADARSQPSKVYFLGNGDCYSHTDYYGRLTEAKVDSIMIARGALIKPWIFEEIEQGQYLDKSASERLALVEQFVRYGLETWGSDEMGVGTTRRFLLEWLSFAYRYVPVGILEHLPPSLQDRPPAWRGRNDLETLLGSDHYKDWIKISEMFLGPAHEHFRFEPKHKSNSYEIEAEG